jgi:CHAD domain-containing protein
MSVERETKLDADDAFEMPDLEAAAKDVAVTDEGTTTYRTTWYDTPDLRLAGWGASLRFREGEDWTVKLPAGEGDRREIARAEHVFAGDASAPPEPAASLVRAFVRSGSLAPIVRATTTRRRLSVEREGEQVGEVVDDAVEVTQAPSGSSRFRELEVERRGDDGRGVARALTRALRDAGARPSGPVPKVVRAIGETPAPEIALVELDKDSAVADVVRMAIAEPVVQLIRHDAGVQLGADPEDVHKARVATRRLRSNLRTFSEWLDPEWATALREDLGWLADALGDVRDAEVMVDRLRERVQEMDEVDRRPAATLIERLSSVREQARDDLLEAMGGERYVELLDRLVEAAREPRLVGDTEASGRTLGSVMDRPWRRLERAVARLGDPPSDGQLHRVRIRAKRARYAAEAIQRVFGDRAAAFARAATELQDVLGRHQDAVVLQGWLRQAATAGRSRLAFTAGMLAAAEHRGGQLARASWPDAWHAVSRKRFMFWS